MTKQEFYTLFNVLTHNTKEYAEEITIILNGLSIPKITTDRELVYPLISSNNWQGLKNFSQNRISEIELKIQEIQTHQNKINSLVDRLFSLKTGFINYYPKPKSQNTWLEFKQNLNTEFVNANIPQEITDEFISKLGNKGGINAYNYQKTQYDNLVNLLNFAFERHLSIYMYHLSCVVYADYNLSENNNLTLGYNVSSKITNLSNVIKSKSNLIYNAITIEDTTSINNITNNFNNWLTSKIQNSIIPILAYCHQKRNSTNSIIDAKRELKASILLKNALFSYSMCRWISWTSNWHREIEIAENLFSAGKTKTNNLIAFTGNNIKISSLVSNPLLYDSSKVKLSGVIQNLNIVHLSATKVLSTAEIINSNGQLVKLTLPHFKLDSGGLVNGCFAEISGDFFISNNESNNQPAITIDRLAIKELAESNWNAWLRYRLRNIFEPISHNLEINFTAEKGSDGIVNPVKYDTTYSKPNLININSKII